MSHPNGAQEQDPHSDPIAAAKPERTERQESGPYESFQSLRQAHGKLYLLSKQSGLLQEKTGQEAIRAFIARSQATGAVLTESNERKAAQEIILYWGAQLAASHTAVASDFVPVLLAPQSAGRALGPSEESAIRTIKLDDQSRDLIRFAAAARLWRDFGRKDGYLLFYKAIEDAEKFANKDRDIDEWVAASKQFRDQQYRTRLKVLGATVAAIIAMIICFWVFATSDFRKKIAVSWTGQTLACPDPLAAGEDSHVKACDQYYDRRKEETFWLTNGEVFSVMTFFQPFFPPFDLSTNVYLKDVTPWWLNAPNLSKAYLIKLHFSNQDVSRASFQASHISGGDFRGAKLDISDFSESHITSTDFADSNLYRTYFDRACLTDVGFHGADLSLASFWSSEVKPDYHGFENTAWWFASGWRSKQITGLVKLDQSNLGQTKVFADHKKRAINDPRLKYAGTLDRAEALNGLAWMLGTWGIDVAKASNQENSNQQNPTAGDPAGSCMQRTDVPTDALEAAEQAVCIVQMSPGRTPDLPNFQDTQAYLLMQNGRVMDAVKIYNAISHDGATLFRHAVALYAVGDQQGGLDRLKQSQDMKYVPGHELHNLDRFIRSASGELNSFGGQIYGYIDDAWPRPQACGPGPSVQQDR